MATTNLNRSKMIGTAHRIYLAGAVFVLATWIWWSAGPAYTQFLASAAQLSLRAIDHQSEVLVRGAGRAIRFEQRTPQTLSGSFRSDPLTISFVFLATLLASTSGPATRLRWLPTAAALLALIHVAAVIASVRASLATAAPETASTLELNGWLAAAQGYMLVGSSASAFVLWWILAPPGVTSHRRQKGRRGRQ